MFPPGSLRDRLVRVIYAEAPALTSAGDRVGFDLANALNVQEVALARRQADAAAAVLGEAQELWVHLMVAQMRPGDEVEVPDLFPDGYAPRHATQASAGVHP